MVEAQAYDVLLLVIEPLAAEAVMPTEAAEEDLADVPELLEDRLDDLLVARYGRADVVIVPDAERLPGLAERGGVLVGHRLGRHAGLGGGLGDLVTVLVGAGEEPHVVAGQS